MAAIPSSCILNRSYSEKRISAFGKPAWVSTNDHTPISFASKVPALFDSIISLQTADVFLKKPVPKVIYNYENFRPSKEKKDRFLALAVMEKWTRKASSLKFWN